MSLHRLKSMLISPTLCPFSLAISYLSFILSLLFQIINGLDYCFFMMCKHRENNRREESKYLECENRQLGLSAIATYIFKPYLLIEIHYFYLYVHLCTLIAGSYEFQ